MPETKTTAPAPSPAKNEAVDVTPDVGGVPDKVRKMIDEQYGKDFQVIAISDRFAHIENSFRSFKIGLPGN